MKLDLNDYISRGITLKYLKENTEIETCRVCKNEFIKMNRKCKGRTPKNIKKVNSICCSSKCSKMLYANRGKYKK